MLVRLAAMAVVMCSTGLAEDLDYWEKGRPRAFVALQPAVGLGYGQLTAQAGWGRPSWIWGGAEGLAFLSPSFVAASGGVKLDLLAITLRAGVRRTFSISHGLLPEANAHSIDEFNSASPRAAYTTLELELSGGVPVPGGFVFWDFE